jgi:hypothetical protein
LFQLFLQLQQRAAILPRADPQDSGTRAAEMAHLFDIQLKTLMPARNVSGYVTDINGLLIFDLSQELQRQVHRFRLHPFDVPFSDVRFASQFVLQIDQAFSDVLANIYRYEYTHKDLSPQRTQRPQSSSIIL